MAKLPLAKKSLGQHWLEDDTSLDAMVQSAQVVSSDTILEIGPGTGTLTDKLIATGANILALEFDQQRLQELKRKYNKVGNVQLIAGDIRRFDFANLPKNYKIVANIPYYLTANLLRILTDISNQPEIAVLLVQKEVAQKVVAKPGDLSQVAIFTQVVYQPTLDLIVPAQLFIPPPKVDSQILILTKRQVPLFSINDVFTRVVKAGFSEKRKKLRTSLSGGLGISKFDAEVLLQKANINLDARAQELELIQWHKLSLFL